MRKIILNIELLLGIALLAAGCRPDTTYRGDKEIYAYLNIVDSIHQTRDSVVLIDREHLLHGDTALIYRSAGNIPLALRIDTTLTEYLLMTKDGLCDLLCIRHTNEYKYVSLACGYLVFHTIDSVWTEGDHDSFVEITKPTVTTEQKTNITLCLYEP